MTDDRHLRPQELTPLEWEAFCYLVGELPLEAQARFEQRLSEETDACLALARVTELSLQVAGAPMSPAPRLVAVSSAGTAQPPARRAAAQVASSALAVCLALTAGITIWMSLSSHTEFSEVASRVSPVMRAGQKSRDASSRRVRDLIVRWRDASLHPESEADDSERREPTWLFEPDGPLAAELSADAGDDLTVPSWMLAAVSLGDSESGEPEDEVWEN